jgi:hypothetical protein
LPRLRLRPRRRNERRLHAVPAPFIRRLRLIRSIGSSSRRLAKQFSPIGKVSAYGRSPSSLLLRRQIRDRLRLQAAPFECSRTSQYAPLLRACLHCIRPHPGGAGPPGTPPFTQRSAWDEYRRRKLIESCYTRYFVVKSSCGQTATNWKSRRDGAFFFTDFMRNYRLQLLIPISLCYGIVQEISTL